MPPQFFRRRRRQRRAGINRLTQRLGAVGTQRALQPAGIQRFGNQIQACSRQSVVSSFKPGRVADADKKSGKQQRRANHCAARIRRQRARPRRVERAEQIFKQRQRPHRRIFGGRKGVVENGVRRGQPDEFLTISELWQAVAELPLRKQRREIAEAEIPSSLSVCHFEIPRAGRGAVRQFDFHIRPDSRARRHFSARIPAARSVLSKLTRRSWPEISRVARKAAMALAAAPRPTSQMTNSPE